MILIYIKIKGKYYNYIHNQVSHSDCFQFLILKPRQVYKLPTILPGIIAMKPMTIFVYQCFHDVIHLMCAK